MLRRNMPIGLDMGLTEKQDGTIANPNPTGASLASEVWPHRGCLRGSGAAGQLRSHMTFAETLPPVHVPPS